MHRRCTLLRMQIQLGGVHVLQRKQFAINSEMLRRACYVQRIMCQAAVGTTQRCTQLI